MPDQADQLFRLGHLYAESSLTYIKGETMKPADRNDFLRYRHGAIKCLRAAIDAGFSDLQKLDNDPAFLALAGHAGFADLRAKLLPSE